MLTPQPAFARDTTFFTLHARELRRWPLADRTFTALALPANAQRFHVTADERYVDVTYVDCSSELRELTI